MTSPNIGWDAARIANLVTAGAIAEANEHVAATLVERPTFLPAKLARGRLLLAEGRAAEAVDWLQPLPEHHPGNLWVLLALVEALLAAGDVDAAAGRLVRDVLPGHAAQRETAALLNRVIAALPTSPRRLAFLEAAHVAAPGTQVVMVKLAGQLFAIGAVARAKTLFDAAHALGPLPPFAENLRVGLLLAEGDHAASLAVLLTAQARDPDNPDHPRRLVRVAQSAGRFDLAAATLRKAVDTWPASWLLLYRANRTFVPEPVDAAIFARLEAVADRPATDLWRFQFALAAAHRGDPRALPVLEQLASASQIGAMAGPARDGLAGALRDGRGPQVVDRDRSVGVEVVRRPGAVATLVLLASVVDGVGYVPTELVARVLHDLPANIVVLRDRYGLGFVKGVAEFGPDEGAMVAAVRALCAGLGAPRIATLGSSAAGYAALRLGLSIDAHACLSFAGPTDLGSEAAPNEGRMSPFAEFRREMRAVAGGDGDLRPRLAAQDRLRLTLVIGADHLPDRAGADRLDGIAATERIVLSGVDHHHSAMPMLGAGTFAPLVHRVVTGAP